MTRAELLERIEPPLAWAREAAAAHDETRARDVVAACADYLTLYRPARYEEYQPALALEPLYNELKRRDDVDADFESPPPCIGDPEQVAIAACSFVRDIVLRDESRLVTELFHEQDVTRLDLNLDGPGHFDDPVWLGGMVRVSRDELNERWTYATRGGRIDPIANGYSLRVTGVRKPPEPVDDIEPLIHVLRMQGKLHDALETALHVIDGPPATPSPADLGALIMSVVAEERPHADARRIDVQTLIEPNLPALQMTRARLRIYLQSLLRWVCVSLPERGTLTILCDYTPGDRVMDVVATAAGPGARYDDRGYAASMRRAVVDAHGGTVEVEIAGETLTVAASLPDPIGRALERWIPGFEAFSMRSQQMLRLLKSGGPTPPEEFLLGGVLEEELERWLLPRLQEPVAVNVAGEIAVKDAGRAGSSVDRLKKALQQIQKGKVKKEIAQPGYAAELLWVFRGDDRKRGAIGAERLTVDDIEALAAHLWSSPPRYVEALRIIANARPPL
jgi:hypothetical protein